MRNWKKKLPGFLLTPISDSWAQFCRPKVAINILMAVGFGYYVLFLVGAHHRHLHNQASKIRHQKEPFGSSENINSYSLHLKITRQLPYFRIL